jgi:hypothetical protein
MSEVSILFNTCDKYKSIWPIFFKYASRYNFINNERNIKIYINNEKEISSLGTDVIFLSDLRGNKNFGINEWGLQLSTALDCILEDFIILVQDDYIFANNFDWEIVDFSLKKMIDEDIDCIHLSPYNFRNLSSNNPIENIPFRKYFFNTQIALWRKSSFSNSLKAASNPWNWELFHHNSDPSYSKFKILQLNPKHFSTCEYFAIIKKGKLINNSAQYLDKVDYFYLTNQFSEIKENYILSKFQTLTYILKNLIK